MRSHHLLKYLSQRYRLHLGTFVDDSEDWQYVGEVGRLCEDAYIPRLNPKVARLRSLVGLLTGEPLTLPYYRHAGMRAWIDDKLAGRSITRVLVFSSAMAQYVTDYIGSIRHCVIDFVDVDSEKWRQYAERRFWPAEWLYRRESKRLLSYERTVARLFDSSVFATKNEAALFQHLAPEVSDRVTYVKNGVDTSYFSPDMEHSNPFPEGVRALVFTGAMDYWANVDAVVWFARTVFPEILARCSSARFYVVGARPTKTVCALARRASVVVTGTVEDVRPYIAHASVCVAPLRVARGVQNKVLEALAMGKPVLATSAAMEGVEPCAIATSFMADEPARLAELAIGLLNGAATADMGIKVREWIVENYNWSRNASRLASLLEEAHEASRASGNQGMPHKISVNT